MNRSRVYFWFLLLFPLVAGIFASELEARFGGGGGYSGGGGSGGSGGGGGDGIGALIYLFIRLFIVLWNSGPIGKVFAILLLIGVICGGVWWSKHKRKQKKNLDIQGRVLHSHRAQRRQSAGVNRIKQADPNFSRVLFLDFARLVYVKFHESRGGLARRNDNEFAVAPFLSPEIRKAVKTSDVTVHEVIVGAIEIKSVQVMQDLVRVMVNIRSNVVEGPEGQKPQRFFLQQSVTFARPKSAITQAPEKVLSLGCPNCGSPEEPGLDGRCPSCGSLTGSGQMDWQIKRIATLRRESVGPPVGADGGVEVGTGDPTIFAPDLAAQKRSLAMRDPEFNWVSFTRRVKHMFMELQQAWVERDGKRIRPYVTDTLFDTVRFWLKRYEDEGIHEVIEDINIQRIEVAKIEHDAWFDAITVRIFASMKEHKTGKDGKQISGSKTRPRSFSEYWTMVRRSDVDHDLAKEPGNCPNCGAPLDNVNMAGVCEYCNGKIVTGHFDWVLAIITQDEDYVG